MVDKDEKPQPAILPEGWRGLGAWNYYFLLKFGLLWAGYLDFHPLDNLTFAAFLLLPIRDRRLNILRGFVALPVGIGLFWHDTWLPGPGSIMHQGDQVAQFSWSYLFELVQRFINWQMMEAAFVLLIAWFFLSMWLRITTLTVLMLVGIIVWPGLQSWFGRLGTAGAVAVASQNNAQPAAAQVAASGNAPPPQALPLTQDSQNDWLASFYASEEKRHVAFPDHLPENSQPFELLVINICSLSWSDLQVTGLDKHPLWSHFDLLFKSFNSATSYSGPAAIRLLRASCGQPSHKALYSAANQECYLFSDLAKLGFTSHLMLDHNGMFGDFLNEVRQFGGMQAPLMSQQGLPVNVLGFDDSPIYDDSAVLQRWLQTEDQEKNPRTATFYNLLPLHDGNHFPGIRKTADYAQRARKLFDELDSFLTQLEQSHRRVMVVIVPEHGAALQGDKMQISGLRDIPSPAITHVPVGIKFTGMNAPYQGSPRIIAEPSSYLALSTLVSRVLDGQVFMSDTVDWAALTRDLPTTVAVSENADAVVIDYNGKPYVSIDKGDWVAYPQ
ncbi:cellulose biosynthesis protein BcsG [Gluconobacter kondonii]|uniref:cellulose biosynthesis protein BcsG n=1 Tax=Gluconobacter kondonii TaxID=941463 RepID=UPI001B8C92BC|nr:cellulose biosynthesis protein BcsG [Gluconobacter kondonii]MBS1081165.1 cellulose biosynthesis protein BcsG [Gluconobacter kondonii]